MTAVKRQGLLCSQVVRGKRRAAVALGRPTVFLASGASRGRILPHDVLSIPEVRYNLLRFAPHFAYKRDASLATHYGKFHRNQVQQGWTKYLVNWDM